MSEDGQKRTFSAERMRTLINNAIATTRKELTAELTAQFRPALDFATEGRQQMAAAAERREAEAMAADAVKAVRSLPHFNEEGVSAAFIAIPKDQRIKMGAWGAMQMAYTTYLTQTVLPTLSASQESKVIEDLRRSAVAGSTSPTATGTPSANPRLRDGNVNDLADHMRKLAAGGPVN